MKDKPSELLFNPKKVFKGEIKKVLKGYPKRSSNFSDKLDERILGPKLSDKFIKDGYAYLLRGAAFGQESGFYTIKYTDKKNIENTNANPVVAAFSQMFDGSGQFISTTTNLLTAASFANGGRIYVVRVPVEDVYSFKSFCDFEYEYLIPDYIGKDEIIGCFKFGNFKQIYDFLISQGLDIKPEDLGVSLEELLNPGLQHVKVLTEFNQESMFLEPLMKEMQKNLEEKSRSEPQFVNRFILDILDKSDIRSMGGKMGNVSILEKKNEKPRRIAIFTDSHGLLEPTEAILENIKSKGIKEIYSLGDNIGLGPNPKEVLDLLDVYGVKSIAGNYEDHINIGLKPFASYMTVDKAMNIEWMSKQITSYQKEMLKSMAHCIELNLGGKKIALCHFANDVRCDFTKHSTWIYGRACNEKLLNPYDQFMYTNSVEQMDEIATVLGFKAFEGNLSTYQRLCMLKDFISKNKDTILSNPYLQGYISYVYDPLFCDGSQLRQVSDYDTIIQGHVHFNRFGKCSVTGTEFYDVRAAGMGYSGLENDMASYIILTETNDGFDISKIDVPYDRKQMEQSILKLELPNNTIKKYTNIH